MEQRITIKKIFIEFETCQSGASTGGTEINSKGNAVLHPSLYEREYYFYYLKNTS